jgi:hypothetical protein
MEKKEMESRNSEVKCNLCLSDKIASEELHGVTYAQTIGNTENFVGSALIEYTMISFAPSSRKQRKTRAYREMLRSRGKKIPRIKKSALRDELGILPGAAMSAADVVRALRSYIKEVQENGMWIGQYKDQLIVESIDGTLKEA